ncbi:phosphatidic acid phosphatase protein-like protein [Leishmania major strain Friedlin]|uniref:Phosphatidic acid phosphatase protein-like protein n=1 Tax=Leishmania major TaxID=5664 RepID=Q4QD76_LEIMA|nr:phosphatidic acid phosphatase protein-like protein [Leishmania major strain Friedlin]CAG9572844.1 phosphatidic_acid_phosphatase_protein-like_protein [Leishmania major strain Friedlin]CAJ07230.1 phosphatidic acid phosphatase protein-like protein [Leishmania major strain Friedlin]|eukprot:XP_001682722.1 phosphatidic acid phosphatase protein-like protein [Leishmania major strain Friedlin]
MVVLSTKEFYYAWNQYHLLDWIVLAILLLISMIVTTSMKPHCRSFSWNDATIGYPSRADTFPDYSLALMVVFSIVFYVIFIWYLVRPLQQFFGEPLDWYCIGGADAVASGEGNAYAEPDTVANTRQPRVRDMQTGRGLVYPWLRAQLWSVGMDSCATAVLKVYAGRLRPDYLSRLKSAGYSSSMSHLPDPQTNPDYYCALMDAHPALKEGRLSFPSGHSSTSFAVCTVVCLFFIAHLRPFARHASFTRLIICLLPISVSLMCAVSRTRDNKHHFSDIIAGSLIGVVSAFLSFYGSFRQVGGAAGIYFSRTAMDIEYEQLRERKLAGGSESSGAAVEIPSAGSSNANYQSTNKREEAARCKSASPISRVNDAVVTFNDSVRRPTWLTERRLNEDPAAVPWI